MYNRKAGGIAKGDGLVPQGHATEMLVQATHGDPQAADGLFPLVYEGLRDLAAKHMRHERADHTLQPTALAHEAYLRLIDQSRVDWKSRAHFLGVASQVIRRILVDHAREKRALKRGGDRDRVTLAGAAAGMGVDVDLLAMNEALVELRELNDRHHRVIELRFFGGLTAVEAAEVLGVSEQTVHLDWRTAKAWLKRRLREED